jgi:hypothetical protein
MKLLAMWVVGSLVSGGFLLLPRGMDFVMYAETSLMNIRWLVALVLFQFFSVAARGQNSQNIIIVTLDGYRWQELFHGADRSILFNDKYTRDTAAVSFFWADDESERRKILMPFMWNMISRNGQLYGNRGYGNKVNCTNLQLISYPGYSEMLVGFSNPAVSSNRKVDNPSPTVLEAIGKHPAFQDEVAAFATWDAFPFILRQSKSRIYVNAGKQTAKGDISIDEQALNHLMETSQVRSDSITFRYAMEYMKRERPRVTLISFDGTDAGAHRGDYAAYLRSAHRADRMLGELWRWVQQQPDYRNKTTLLVTTDHGRGTGKNNWRKHKLLIHGSRQIWFAVMGPDTPSFGEMRIKSVTYQRQAAKTIAAFLGLPYRNEQRVGEVVQTMIAISPAVRDETSARSPQPLAD